MDSVAALSHALTLHQAGRLDEAQAAYDAVLASDPKNPDALCLRGAVDLQLGRTSVALARFDQALAVRPDHAAAHANRAAALLALGRYGEAIIDCEHALAANPGSANIWANRAAILNGLRRPEKALVSVDKALALDPRHSEALGPRTEALRQLGRLDEALVASELSLAADSHADAWALNSMILLDLKRYAAAVAACDRAIALNPDSARAHGLRANALARLHRFHDALLAYDHAIALAPDDAHIHYNRAVACNDAGHWAEALASGAAALKLAPDYAAAFVAQAIALRGQERYADAVTLCDRALALMPGLTDARLVRGLCLESLARYEEALADLEAVAAAQSETPLVHGMSLLCSLQICKWDTFAAKAAACLTDIDSGGAGTGPFAVMALDATQGQQQAAAARYFADTTPARDTCAWPAPSAGGKLRLGYFSADFFDHATSRLAAGLFEYHDRRRFEVTAFAFGRGAPSDPMRARLERAFDHMIDVSDMTPEGIAALARARGIDIAIDLKGFTKNSRPAVFALGAAPIQVNYLGYPGTLGSSRYDYIVGDRFVTPAAHAASFSERIVTMPHSYQVNDSRRAIPGAAVSRRDLGLPENGFVFCSFNNTFKITPAVFDIWMRLLKAVDGSVLWQLEDNPAAGRNLRLEAARRGVDPVRLVFAPRVAAALHLARHRAADVFLDSFPCNAHTTASDALWAGLPVITKLGDAFTGRVAARLLAAAGLPELITATARDYEALALSLARSPQVLAGYRQRLEQQRASSALFDTARFTRGLEAAYRRMWDIYAAGGRAAHIAVAEDGTAL